MMTTVAFELLHKMLGIPRSLDPHLYKAPHANRGTPRRLRHGKMVKFVDNKKTGARIVKRRPFKGHRP